MSKTDDTFESAFPHNFIDQSESEFDGEQFINFGLSIRDYFAARAMQAMIAKMQALTPDRWNPNPEYVAGFSYEMADAMLEEREK